MPVPYKELPTKEGVLQLLEQKLLASCTAAQIGRVPKRSPRARGPGGWISRLVADRGHPRVVARVLVVSARRRSADQRNTMTSPASFFLSEVIIPVVRMMKSVSFDSGPTITASPPSRAACSDLNPPAH